MLSFENINSYGAGTEGAFESLIVQLFHRYLKAEYGLALKKFRCVSRKFVADGGMEAYGQLRDGGIIAVQAKYFSALDSNRINKIRASVRAALVTKPQLKEYIVCLPIDPCSDRVGPNGRITADNEQKRIDTLTAEFPNLKITWWGNTELFDQILQHIDLYQFWFKQVVIPLPLLAERFELSQKNAWLRQSYKPELHHRGIIDNAYQALTLSRSYKRQLKQELQLKIKQTQCCLKQVKDIQSTAIHSTQLNDLLTGARDGLETFLADLQDLRTALQDGNEQYSVKPMKEFPVASLVFGLKNIDATHRQKAILPLLLKSLKNVELDNPSQYFLQKTAAFRRRVTHIRGRSGTGKTQGTAHCVQEHLRQDMPAIIIRAKDIIHPSSWGSILSQAFDLTLRDANEIFNYLQNHAVFGPGKREQVKALICIDGVDEAVEQEEQWCNRINEAIGFGEKYPAIRFLFTSGLHFRRDCVPQSGPAYEEIFLPEEGDVPIRQVVPRYLLHYNITVSSPSIRIRDIDTLFALRFFCEDQQGRTITPGDMIVIDPEKILNERIRRYNQEFLHSINKPHSKAQPVHKALSHIYKHYYNNTELKHDLMLEIVHSATSPSLSPDEANLLVDFLVMQGILLPVPRTNDAPLPETEHFYTPAYPSVIEYYMAKGLYMDWRSSKKIRIPELLIRSISRPESFAGGERSAEFRPNNNIVQHFANILLSQGGLLLGEDSLLIERFEKDQMLRIQLEALRVAPPEKSVIFKNKVDALFKAGGLSQYLVLKHLIIPSCRCADAAFGATYIHEVLSSQPSAFERDRWWSGPDAFDAPKSLEYTTNLERLLLTEHGGAVKEIGEKAPHNGLPMLYGWALTTLSQPLRHSLRIALTKWAIIRPLEFIELLNKMFFSNDPQLQEDLACIVLGMASHVKDREAIQALAEWGIHHVFSNKLFYRNIIIRHGFRAMVERGDHEKCISPGRIAMARPSPISTLASPLLPLSFEPIPTALRTPTPLSSPHYLSKEEAYPLAGDLGNYVIKTSYQKFLNYTFSSSDNTGEEDLLQARVLLGSYARRHDKPRITSQSWALAAATSYIRETLGLIRKEGNSSTEASHGEKSRNYTCEEKYTWIAVHYLQGYLSDHIPMKKAYKRREWITDYAQLTDIPNPGEEIVPLDNAGSARHHASKLVIPQDIDAISHVDFHKWLQYDHTTFHQYGKRKKWLALYNKISLKGRRGSHLLFNSIACLIKKEDLIKLKESIYLCPERLNFTGHLDRLKAYPDTTGYSSPKDIVWMNWIKEYNEVETFYADGREAQIYTTLVSTIRPDQEGSLPYTIPSRLVRQILDISSFADPCLTDPNGKLVGFINRKCEGFDTQEQLLVDRTLLEKALDLQGWEICWFVEYRIEEGSALKHMVSPAIGMQSKKYLIYRAGDQLLSIDFRDYDHSYPLITG